MAKMIDTVGIWFDAEGVAIRTVVNYSDGDVKNFPGDCAIPNDEWWFMKSAKNNDRINLSNGKTISVWFN